MRNIHPSKLIEGVTMSEEIFSNSSSSFLRGREEVVYRTYDSSTLTPGFPKNCLVELSNSCNHKCIFCTNPRMERGKGVLDIELYKKFLSESYEMGLREVGLYTTCLLYTSPSPRD